MVCTRVKEVNMVNDAWPSLPEKDRPPQINTQIQSSPSLFLRLCVFSRLDGVAETKI